MLVFFGSVWLAWVIVAYGLSRVLKRNDVADGMWGLGFVALGWAAFSLGALSTRAVLALVLVTLWGFRLSIYLWLRQLRKDEDFRYATWRAQWGRSEPWRALLQVFVLQGFLLVVIVSPVLVAILSPPQTLGAVSFVGGVLVLWGILIEAWADAELVAFKARPDNRGRRMHSGWWGRSRHPNYFGELLVWWGFALLAWETPLGLWTLVSPLVLTLLLMGVSGAPLLDPVLNGRPLSDAKGVPPTRSYWVFGLGDALRWALMALTLALLDAIWFASPMGEFYMRALSDIGRLDGGQWAPLLWAAVAVYGVMALGLGFFAVQGSSSAWEAGFRGAVLGFVVYGVYELTNLALLTSWVVEVALVDTLWGSLLFGGCAFLGRWAPKIAHSR